VPFFRNMNNIAFSQECAFYGPGARVRHKEVAREQAWPFKKTDSDGEVERGATAHRSEAS